MKRTSMGTYVWGLILIFLGVGFIAENAGVWNFGNIIGTYWPVLLMLVGLGDLASGKYWTAIFWLGLGAILQIDQLNLLHFDVWSLVGPFILIIIGLRILFKPMVKISDSKDADNYAAISAVFGGNEKKMSSKEFKGASINAIFGGASIDLRSAELSKEGANVDVLVLFGGADIIAPDNMPVKLDILSIFGGSSDERKIESVSKTGPAINVRGTVLFGGFGVKDKE